MNWTGSTFVTVLVVIVLILAIIALGTYLFEFKGE
jgi:hypothetical protein